MLNKPTDFDKVKAYGEFEPLELGGHIMEVKSVTFTKSSTGRDMLQIYLDTAADDSQPHYFSEQYKHDIRSDSTKKWGCIVYQLVYDLDGMTNRGFKTFITSVEESNPGFQTSWGPQFEACFRNKRVCGVVGEEDYINKHGEIKTARKVMSFRSLQTLKEGKVKIPTHKTLDKPTISGYSVPSSAGANMQIPASSYGQQVPTSAPPTFHDLYPASAAPNSNFEQIYDDDLPF